MHRRIKLPAGHILIQDNPVVDSGRGKLKLRSHERGKRPACARSLYMCVSKVAPRSACPQIKCSPRSGRQRDRRLHQRYVVHGLRAAAALRECVWAILLLANSPPQHNSTADAPTAHCVLIRADLLAAPSQICTKSKLCQATNASKDIYCSAHQLADSARFGKISQSRSGNAIKTKGYCLIELLSRLKTF